MINSHPHHPAHRNLRACKTPVVLRKKRRKLAISLSTKRLRSIGLLLVLMVSCAKLNEAQTAHTSRLVTTTSAENVLSTTPRKGAQPNLSIGSFPNRAAGGRSFVKRAALRAFRFVKAVAGKFGEGEKPSERSRSSKGRDKEFKVKIEGSWRPTKVATIAFPDSRFEDTRRLPAALGIVNPDLIKALDDRDDQVSLSVVDSKILGEDAGSLIKEATEQVGEIMFCKFDLPDQIKQAHASFSLIYSFQVDEEGQVVKPIKLTDDYVGEEIVFACLKNWRFKDVSHDSKMVMLMRWEHGIGWVSLSITGKNFSRVIRITDPEIDTAPEITTSTSASGKPER